MFRQDGTIDIQAMTLDKKNWIFAKRFPDTVHEMARLLKQVYQREHFNCAHVLHTLAEYSFIFGNMEEFATKVLDEAIRKTHLEKIGYHMRTGKMMLDYAKKHLNDRRDNPELVYIGNLYIKFFASLNVPQAGTTRQDFYALRDDRQVLEVIQFI